VTDGDTSTKQDHVPSDSNYFLNTVPARCQLQLTTDSTEDEGVEPPRLFTQHCFAATDNEEGEGALGGEDDSKYHQLIVLVVALRDVWNIDQMVKLKVFVQFMFLL
jgi:hypothetical protein